MKDRKLEKIFEGMIGKIVNFLAINSSGGATDKRKRAKEKIQVK